MMSLLKVSCLEQGLFRPQWLLRCGVGLAASLFALSALSAVATATESDAAGIVGVPTDAVAPVSVADIEQSTAQSSDAQSPSTHHERGYPANLDAARRMPMLPGAEPTHVNMTPPPFGGETSFAPTSDAPALGTNLNGIGDTGSIPADPMLAVGTLRIIQVVNSSIRITTRTGGSTQTSTLAAMMGNPAGSSGSVFDPRVQYDHFANRFVVLALKTNSARTDSWYLVSVSKTATPTTAPSSWFTYHIRSDFDGSTNTSNWADYAPIGFDNTYFYITSNQFNSAGAFQYGKIRRYAKAPFYSGGTVSGIEWIKMPGVNNTIQPAVTFGVPGDEWLVSVPFGVGNTLQVFRITGNNLFRFTVPVGSTALPNLARQKGTSNLIHSGDNRLLNAVFSNNRLYAGHTVGTSSFPCASRFLGINTSNINAPTRTLDRVVGNSTFDLYYPAVATNPAGSASSNLAVVANFSSATRFAGITYTQMTPTGTIQPLAMLKEGENSYFKTYSGTRNRWGDYNGICRDPTNSNRFWFNAMYARTSANTWGTWVGSTTLPAATAPAGVQATYDTDSGQLLLTGGDRANHVDVSKDESGVKVTGKHGTRINGRHSVTLVTADKIALSVNLGGGNDQLTITGLQLSGMDALLGEGNDKVFLVLSSVDVLRVDGGDGIDVVSNVSSNVAESHLDSVP